MLELVQVSLPGNRPGFDAGRRAHRRQVFARRAVALAAAVFGLSGCEVGTPRRGPAERALARQLAMYLVHVGCGLTQEEVGAAFGRDRTTVAHACARIEDERDDACFDRMVDCLEAALRFGGDAGADLGGDAAGERDGGPVPAGRRWHAG